MADTLIPVVAGYTGSTVTSLREMTNAEAIKPINGGTGVVNNPNNNITFTGNYSLGLTLTNTTAITLPVSGTIITLAGIESLTNKTLILPTVTNYTETVYSGGVTGIPVGGGTTVLDLANGTIQSFALTGSQIFTLPVTTAGKSFTLVLTGNFAPTINAGSGRTLKWAGGSAPARTASAGKYDIYVFTAIDSIDTLGCDGGRNY